ncbi:hypothetical protein AB0G32_00150 [Streptomyces sp. NPDC023723]|uniref:hypothetical protein n=1 Tax=Streptomyces sp. NPDC023723 TaxID=3154323 RepID=UPI0033E64AC6
MARLPSPGASYDRSVSAEGTRIEDGDSTYTVDLRGHVRFEIRDTDDDDDRDRDRDRTVRAVVTRFRMTGNPESAGSDLLGEIVVELDDDRDDDHDDDRDNLIRLTDDDRLEHLLALGLRVTLGRRGWDASGEQAAGAEGADAEARRRRVLRTREPARLRANDLDRFPPDRDDEYRLRRAVDLYDRDDSDRDDSDRVVATIERFPLEIGGRDNDDDD